MGEALPRVSPSALPVARHLTKGSDGKKGTGAKGKAGGGAKGKAGGGAKSKAGGNGKSSEKGKSSGRGRKRVEREEEGSDSDTAQGKRRKGGAVDEGDVPEKENIRPPKVIAPRPLYRGAPGADASRAIVRGPRGGPPGRRVPSLSTKSA